MNPVTGTQLRCAAKSHRCDLADYSPVTSFQASYRLEVFPAAPKCVCCEGSPDRNQQAVLELF